MMNGFYNIAPVYRVTKTNRIHDAMTGQNFTENKEQEQSMNFSDVLKEACRHDDDSLAHSMENKVNYYGSDAQAVFYSMSMSRSFKA